MVAFAMFGGILVAEANKVVGIVFLDRRRGPNKRLCSMGPITVAAI